MSTLKKKTELEIVVKTTKQGNAIEEAKKEIEETRAAAEDSAAVQKEAAKEITTSTETATEATTDFTEATKKATAAETDLGRTASTATATAAKGIDTMSDGVGGFSKVLGAAGAALNRFLWLIGAVSLALEILNKLKEWTGYNKRVEEEAEATERAKKATDDYAAAMQRIADTRKEMEANTAMATEAQRVLDLTEKRKTALTDILMLQNQEARLAAQRQGNEAELAQINLDLALLKKQVTEEEYSIQSAALRERAADEQRALAIAQQREKLAVAQEAERMATESTASVASRSTAATELLGNAIDQKYLADLLAAREAAQVVADQRQAEADKLGNTVEGRPAREAAIQAGAEVIKLDRQLAPIREAFAEYGLSATETTKDLAAASAEFYAKFAADQELIKQNDKAIADAKREQLALTQDISALEASDKLADEAAVNRISAEIEKAKVSANERQVSVDEATRLAAKSAAADARQRDREYLQGEVAALQAGIAEDTDGAATTKNADDKKYFEARITAAQAEIADLQSQIASLDRADSEASRDESDLSRQREAARLASDQQAAQQTAASIDRVSAVIESGTADQQLALDRLVAAATQQGQVTSAGLARATTAINQATTAAQQATTFR